ncbi:MAG: hypothetical protein RL660_2047 [Bacteroidota bacterium]|jgi:hypothetical protein
MKKFTVILFVLSAWFVPATLHAQCWNGLTLIGKQASGGGGGGTSDTLKLVDTNGVMKKYIKCTGGNNAYGPHLEKGGYFYRTVNVPGFLTGGGMHGRCQKYDWSGNLLWDWTYASASYQLHHDFCVLPNGNVLFICYDVKPAGSVTSAGGTFSGVVWNEKIIEVQPTGATTGTIVWEWSLWDRLMQKTNSSGPNYFPTAIDHPERLDVATITVKDFAHCNGIDFDSARNQIIVSSHFLDEFYIIDHSTTTAEAASHTGGNSGKGGDFLYRYGYTSNYGGGTAGNVNDVLHDAHLVRYGAYKDCISFFHNKGVSSSQSCGDMVMPPRSGNNYTITAGQPYQPLSYTKRIPAGGYSSNMSSFEQFPNGNYMICLALSGSIREYDSAGTLIKTISAGGTCAQSHRYDMCDIATPKPVVPPIEISGTSLSVNNTAGYGLQWYKDGVAVPGATSNTLAAGTDFGEYSVAITDSFLCTIKGGDKGYWPTTVDDIVAAQLALSPNPTSDVLEVSGIYIAKPSIKITDAFGKLVLQVNDKRVSLRNYAAGTYFVEVYDGDKKIHSASILKN